MRQFALITFALVACLADNTYGEVQGITSNNNKRHIDTLFPEETGL